MHVLPLSPRFVSGVALIVVFGFRACVFLHLCNIAGLCDCFAVALVEIVSSLR